MQSRKHSWLVYTFIRNALFILYRIFFKFQCFGAEKVPSKLDSRGVILAPNHASFLDPPMMALALDRHVTYLAKDYLFKAFFVGWVLRSVGALPIKTRTDDFKSIRELVRILKEGRCTVIFPEGTRSADGVLRPAEDGIGFLAMKSQATVVPVYIDGSFEAFSRHQKFFKCSPIKVYFGDPFVPALEEEFKNFERAYAAVGEKIMGEIKKLRDKALN